jgi:hypothetical protein
MANLYGFSGSAMATPTGSQIVVLLTNADQSLSIFGRAGDAFGQTLEHGLCTSIDERSRL